MALDSSGNWTPVLPDNPALTTQGWGELRFGTSAPTSGFGNVGDGFILTTNGNFYVKKTTGWELVSGGGGAGIAQVIATTDANPNTALITPDDPAQGAIFTQDGANLTVLWRWDVAAQTWRQVSG